ncbi:natural resistance-associated macrophage family protein [Mycobacterium xenopi 3993]|nr:natural resistance-associated macrophage family protein [Mycobacterium xenopi 3993]
MIVAANLMAGLVQYLSAKLGLVTGRSLPEAVGQRMNRPARLAYWVQAELVAMATDLAEVVGGRSHCASCSTCRCWSAG